MTTAMEKSLWSRQKQSAVQEFINEQRKIVSTAAGRGFLLAPGSMYEAETGLEIDIKQKLSDLSHKILSDAVDRDIKQAGLNYDLAFKLAVMTWETEKQALLSDWDRELAELKQTQALQEEELAQLAIEVSRRGALLINAKTAIELQMEALRAELAGLEDDSADYEVKLAQQKLVTARKKLEIIPILQQILVIEQQILVKEDLLIDGSGDITAAEKRKTEYLKTLVNAHKDIADDKKRYLLPKIQELADVSYDLADEIKKELPFEIKIMAQRVLDAGIAVEKAEKQILITGAQVDTEFARLNLAVAKIALASTQRDYELALRNLDIQETLVMTSAEDQAHISVLTQEAGTQSNTVNIKTEIANLEFGQKLLSSNTLTVNDIENIVDIEDAHSTSTVRSAEASAKAKITANLTHLIG